MNLLDRGEDDPNDRKDKMTGKDACPWREAARDEALETDQEGGRH